MKESARIVVEDCLGVKKSEEVLVIVDEESYAIGAALFGLIGFIGFRIYPVPIAKEVATLGLSLLGYWIGNMIGNYSVLL